jgi:small subunit ribosomal protein S3
MKIKISGRLNGRPRAKHRIISIGNGVPAITLNSNIDYAESTAYTLNGTLGIKVWVSNQI